jgi:hypothetical protein
MRLIAFFTALLLLSSHALAGTYSWTDQHGTMHFTDDIGRVPAKYRAKALKESQGRYQYLDQTVEPSRPETKADLPAGIDEAAKTAATIAPLPVPEEVTGKTSFGGRTAAEWQQQFRALNSQMNQIQQQQEQLRQEGGDGKTLISRGKANELQTRGQELGKRYEEVRQQYNQLVEQANKVGLPPQFAQ